MVMVEIPALETPRLRLTALSERHFDDYAAMLADPDSTRWVGDGQPLDRTNAWRSLAMLLGHWQLRGCGMWALELKDSGEFIGRAGLMYPDGWPDLEMGRSEEHTSELQSLMHTPYAVFCLKKNKG